MNLLHVKYAVEVAHIGSVKRTAEALLVTQPNLSRCIRELEESLGILIFDRTSRGMTLTALGEQFIRRAEKLLEQVEELEQYYLEASERKQLFSISVPRTGYLSDVFTRFTREISPSAACPPEVHYWETSTGVTIQNVVNRTCRLGIIRYNIEHERYYRNLLEENGLEGETVMQFQYHLLFNRESPLAEQKEIFRADLTPLLEVVQDDFDSDADLLHLSPTKKERMTESTAAQLHLFDRGSQFDLLAENPSAFLWEAPLPRRLLERHGLVQRRCADNESSFCDLLIRRRETVLTPLERQFLSVLYEDRPGERV